MSTFPTKEKALGMYKKMYTIRKYEESIYYLFLEGIMPGSIHQSTGEEASAVGMLYDLGKDDWMATTHRPAGHDIAKGVSVKSMMCEMFGKAEGCCKGKGGAMHTGDISVGAMTANAIVGGDLPIAAGILCAEVFLARFPAAAQHRDKVLERAHVVVIQFAVQPFQLIVMARETALKYAVLFAARRGALHGPGCLCAGDGLYRRFGRFLSSGAVCFPLHRDSS